MRSPVGKGAVVLRVDVGGKLGDACPLLVCILQPLPWVLVKLGAGEVVQLL